MKYRYIKLNAADVYDPLENSNGKSWINRMAKNFIYKTLETFLPKGNPDFDDKIDLVKVWILEINESNEKPSREIGLDEKGNTILIMPWKGNYGFWTDSNISMNDFTHTRTTILKSDFNKLWQAFEQKNSSA